MQIQKMTKIKRKIKYSHMLFKINIFNLSAKRHIPVLFGKYFNKPHFGSFHVHLRSWNGVLKNFANFTGKDLSWSFFLTKFIEKRLQHRCFSVQFAKFLKKSNLENICERLLLLEPSVKYFILNSEKTYFFHAYMY